MSSKAPPAADDPCNTETEDGAAASLQKKRSRRVSFAEITSVHVFDRDEYETPPEDPRHSSSFDSELAQFNRDLGFLCDGDDLKDNSQNKEQDEDDDDDRRPFLRPIESPSPGSTIGSATSNDEDNFFGPVSSSFIRPGRLSDSAASDDNHEITLDSKSFTQHYRSLARSDSGGDLKTPTAVHLKFDENTPSQNTIGNQESSMLLNLAKNLKIGSSSTSVEKSSGDSDSNDMSFVQENPKKYDYERLPFGLDTLLAEGVQDLHTDDIAPFSNKIIVAQSPIHTSKRRGGSKESNDITDEEDMGLHDSDDMLVELKTPCANGYRESTGAYDTRDDNMVNSNTDLMLPVVAPFGDKLEDTNDDSDPSSTCHPTDMSTDDLNQSLDLLIKGISSTTNKEADPFEMRPQDSHLVINCTTSNQESELPQLDVFAKLDHRSPLARSLSSFSAKRRQPFFHDTRASKKLHMMTSPQNPSPSVTGKIERHVESVQSLQRSISKLKMLEASPFSSNFNVKMNSVLLSSESLFRTPPCTTSLERNKEDAQIKRVDDSGGWRDQLQIVAQGNRETSCIKNLEISDVGILGNVVDGSYATDHTRIVKPGTSPAHRSAEVLASEQSIGLARVRGLVSQLTSSGKKTKMDLFTSEDSVGSIVVTPGRDSLFPKVAFNHEKIKKAAATPSKSFHSLDKSSKRKSVSEFQGIISMKDESTIKNVDLGHDTVVTENVLASISTTIAKELDSVFLETANSGAPFTETDDLNELTGLQPTSDGKIKCHDVQDETRILGKSQNDPTDEESQCLIIDGNLETQKEPVTIKKLMKAYSPRPSRKVLHNVSYNESSRSTVLALPQVPNSSQLSNETEDFSARKRLREDVIPRENNRENEIGRIESSPKLHESVGCEVLPEHSNESNMQKLTVGREMRLQHWTDVLSEFLAKKLLPPSIDKLNLQGIDALEDRLIKLQRLHTYELHHNLIRSQKSAVKLANLQHKRTAEIKMLLQRFMHGHARLQSMLVKQERLQTHVQLLRHGIQESQSLKLNSLPRLTARCHGGNVNSIQCLSSNIKGRKEKAVPGEKETELRHVLDALKSKIMTLSKSLQASCKMKEELCHSDCILAVNDYLKKKACCKILRLELQLWTLDNLFTVNGDRCMVLNYMDFLIQRITIKAGTTSKITFLNELNDVTIVKHFPNMDAWAAFSFSLNANTVQNYVGCPSLAREIQVTSSVLGNLLDVVDEVQEACFELQNLMKAKFCVPSVGQLDLRLYFFDMKSGLKVALTVDMSSLKWGIYPLNIVPNNMESLGELSQESFPEPLSSEIGAAVQSLSVGYLRILRLCRTVSQVFQAWSG